MDRALVAGDEVRECPSGVEVLVGSLRTLGGGGNAHTAMRLKTTRILMRFRASRPPTELMETIMVVGVRYRDPRLARKLEAH